MAQTKGLSKEEYEKIIMHGAAEIMQKKKMALSEQDYDIDKLVEEGIKNANRVKEQAAQQAD